MTTFLFWNLNRKRLESIVANLVLQHNVDVVMLVECTIPISVMLQALNPEGNVQYHFAPTIGCEKVVIYTKFSPEFLQPKLEADRLTIRELKLPGLTKVLLAVTHFQSKLYMSDQDQAEEARELARSIYITEKEVQHANTVLVGDLNMNPFEDGLVSVTKLNAVMTRQIALRGTRKVKNQEYPFFYNPMWGYFGDVNEGPSGTYYYDKSRYKTFFWNIFDQVLLRPALIDHFQTDTLKILSTDGTVSLLSKHGVPDNSITSDHLPVLFKLDL